MGDKGIALGKRYRPELLVVLVLVALALAVRLYRLQEIPPGLFIDEAANGMDVLDILDGHHPIFFERNNGREPLFIYLQALVAALLGPTPLALRLTAALIGAATVPAVYWMVREAFAANAVSRWLAFWTGICLALSYWHLTFSRMGLRAIMVPLLASITFAWFWRAWWRLKSDGPLPRTELILCGISLGVSLYTYTSARLVPVLLLMVALAGILQERHSRTLCRRRVLALVLILALGLIVVLPLGIYFASNPSSFVGRAGQVSVWGDHPGGDSVVLALVKNLVKTAGAFGVIGDPNLRHNPASRPAFDLLLSAWLMAGIVLAFIRRRSLPHLFALLWLVVMALPAFFSDWAPHTLRLLGVLPAACLLAVLAMVEAGRWLGGILSSWRGGRWQWVAAWLPLPFLILSGSTGVRDYFVTGQGEALRYAYGGRYIGAASLASQHKDSAGVWLIPVWPVFYEPESGYVFDFLLARSTLLRLVDVGEDAAPGELRKLTEGQTYAHLLQWHDPALEPDTEYVLSDAKNLVAFLLRKYGRAVGEGGSDLIGYTTYELPSTPDYRVTSDLMPAAISFEGVVKLTGAAYGHTATSLEEPAAALDEKWLPSGHDAWAVLYWQRQAPSANNLKTSLYLLDEDGHLAGQVDDFLASDRYLLLDTWEEGEQVATYSILPILSGIAPGRYKLYVAVYDPETMRRLPVLDATGAPGETAALLGDLEVTPPLAPPEVAPAHVLPGGTNLGSDLTLLGYDLPARSLNPGERLALLLYWRADSKPKGDYVVGVELRDAQGQTVARQEVQPANGRYPTTEWSAGEVVRDWHDLSLAPDMSPGDYELIVTLYDGPQELGRVSLGTVEVGGRPHIFTPPATRYSETYRLAESIAFMGYDLSSSEIQSGSPISLTLYWQSLAPVDKSYTAFVHLLGPDGRVWAQQDNPPGQGTIPTSGWVQGEYVADPYQLVVRPEAPVGEYRIEVGMYDPATGQRLPVAESARESAGDRILLSQPIRITGR